MNEKIENYAEDQEKICIENDRIDKKIFDEYGVYKGLRNEQGKGVLTGLTNISKITSHRIEKGKQLPADGELWYRGYPVDKLIESAGTSLGFEKVAYLLIMGELPDSQQEKAFFDIIGECRSLPVNFTRDVIMKAPSADIMNSITKSILTLSSYDSKVNDSSIANNLRQCIQLISQFPMLAAYAYNAYNHYEKHASMFIHHPDPKLSTAENLLMLLRPDKEFTSTEAKVLDTALILHMEHGGGNNSTFTTRVVTSSGSDAYSTTAAAMCSLKGPRHGGANIKVMKMIADIRNKLCDCTDEEEPRDYLTKIVCGEAFDRSGLIYGMGHAIYSLSDPREIILKEYVKKLACEKGRQQELALYEKIEELAPQVIAEKRKIIKGVSPNIDFYSGFVYELLGIPVELYTAIFAIARIVGWSAHRIEELVCMDKIIRPAYMSIMKEKTMETLCDVPD